MAELLGARESPPFNLMQMIMEGPKGYFGRRGQLSDQLWLADQEQRLSGRFAQSLLDSPAFDTAIANPYDRRAQFGLWAVTQGGPANIAQQGANWLQTAFANAYDREGRILQNDLDSGRIRLSTDEQIRFEQFKIDAANRQFQQQLQMVLGTDENGQLAIQTQRQQDMAYDILAKTTGIQPRPDGMSVSNVGGNFAFVPSLGSDQWRKSMEELTPMQAITGAIGDLTKMDQASYDTGRAKVLTTEIMLQLKNMYQTGTLDQQTAEVMSNMVQEYSRLTGYGMGDFGMAMEKLRGLQIQIDKRVGDWKRKWLLDPSDPRIGDPYRSGSQLPARPKGSADEAMPHRTLDTEGIVTKTPRG